MLALNLLTPDQAESLERAYRRLVGRDKQRRRRATKADHCAAVQKSWRASPSGQVALKAAWSRYSKTDKHKACRERNRDAFKALTHTRRHRGAKDAELVPAVFETQSSACAICETRVPGKRTWHADHDHVTGLLRGLLCARCNTGLGLLKDSRETLTAAVGYLHNPPASRVIYKENFSPLTEKEMRQLRARKKKGMVNAHRMPELVAFQNNRCAICDAQEPGKNGWSADHDHTTGLLRGALCSVCNAGIGRFSDSIRLLESAISYLDNPPAAQVRRVS